MNFQIQDKLRRIYREVEKSKPDWKRYTNDPVELANIMIDKDVEVRSELTGLITAIFEDIADPNRSDSFTEFGEEVEGIVLSIVSEKPELSDSEISKRLSECDKFYELTVKQSTEKALDVVYSKEVQDKIQDHKRDIAELEEMRRGPHSYYGVSEKNIVGV